MRTLLERSIATVESRLVLLAPPDQDVPGYFRNVNVDPTRHRHLVEEMQRLRGSIYVNDGAVKPEHLEPGGLHRTPEDQKSWHLLMLDSQGDVSSCAWYLEHDGRAGFDELRLRNCPLTRVEGWRDKLWAAVESEMTRARSEQLRFAEVGGWAVSKRSRCTSEGLVLALAAYSLGKTLGGALGITTATVRHSSSTILRRIGGSLLDCNGTTIPPYYDPKYDCQMELLRFDSRRPNAKYAGLVDLLGRKLASIPIILAASLKAEPYAPLTHESFATAPPLYAA